MAIKKTWLIPAAAAALLGATMALPPAFAQTDTGTTGTAGGTATAGGKRPNGADDIAATPVRHRATMSGRHVSKTKYHGRHTHHSVTNSGTTGMHSSRTVGARNHSTDGTAGGRVGAGPTDTGTGSQ